MYRLYPIGILLLEFSLVYHRSVPDKDQYLNNPIKSTRSDDNVARCIRIDWMRI